MLYGNTQIDATNKLPYRFFEEACKIHEIWPKMAIFFFTANLPLKRLFFLQQFLPLKTMLFLLQILREYWVYLQWV